MGKCSITNISNSFPECAYSPYHARAHSDEDYSPESLKSAAREVSITTDSETRLIKSIVQDDKAQLISLSRFFLDTNKSSTMDRTVVSKLLHLCCAFDSVDCATALVNGELGAMPLVNEVDTAGLSPLHAAAEAHAARCVEMLLRKRARTDLKTRDGRGLLPLELSLSTTRMDVFWNPDDHSIEDLVVQLSEKDLTAIKLLSEKTKEVDEVAYASAIGGRVVDLAALLVVAAQKVNESILELHDADLNSKEKTTIYERAADEAIIKLLLKTNIDVNDVDTEGNSALHWCLKTSKGSCFQQIKIMWLLLKHGARVNQKNKLGLTAVHLAAANGNLHALKVLLLEDPDCVNSKTETKETPLFFAVKNDCKDCAEVLLRWGASTEVFNLRKQRPVDLAESQDMRFLLNPMNISLTNRAFPFQQKYTAWLQGDEVIAETCEELFDMKDEGKKNLQEPRQMKQGREIIHSSTARDLEQKIFVGGLPPSVDSDLLHKFFEEKFGSVADASVVGALTGDKIQSRGFGFVTFKRKKSVTAAVEARYVSVMGKQIEIKSALPKCLLSAGLQKSPQQHEQEQSDEHLPQEKMIKEKDTKEMADWQTPSEKVKRDLLSWQSPNEMNEEEMPSFNTTEEGKSMLMSWVDTLICGQPKACSNESQMHKEGMPTWLITFKKWLPHFLRQVAMRDGVYALSSLKADFRAAFGLELDHASLGFSKLSEFMRSLPDLCHIKFVPIGKQKPANHMILLPSLSKPHCQPVQPLNICNPSCDAIECSSNGDSSKAKGFQDVPLVSNENSDSTDSSSMLSHQMLEENPEDTSVSVHSTFLQFLKPDLIFHARPWLFVECDGDTGDTFDRGELGDRFKGMKHSPQERHLVLEVLASKRNNSSLFFLREFDFYDNYKANIVQGRCFGCNQRRVLWANFPCQHLLWCADCKLQMTQAASNFEHKCVFLMARGPIASLFRAYASKSKVSRARFLLSNQNLRSFRQFNNWVLESHQLIPPFDLPYHQISSSIGLIHPQLPSWNPKFTLFSAINGRPFSSSVQDGDDENRSSTEMEENINMDFVETIRVEGVIEKTIEDGVGDVNGSTFSYPITSVEEHENQDSGSNNKIAVKKNVQFRDPVEIYQELRNAEKNDKLRRSDWEILREIFFYFANSGWAANQALAIYIGMSFFPTAAHKFRNFFFRKCSAQLAMYLVSLGPCDAAVRFLFPIFVEYCIEEFPDEIKRFRSMIESADLTKPYTWFPFARAMKRRIIYHCGPTNSGKTYNALQRFMEAKKGVYCSPLRLLAMEVFDKVNALGVYCSLHTGQEKKNVPFSNHVACTVEMVSTDELYDVAVIDEIQMMADSFRGFAWTRALLGLKADEIHLCGDPSVLNIVRKICSETGDELLEHHYDRFKPLVVEAKTLLGDLRNVRSGDCVVAFSRREIFEVKLAIEKHTKHRCCVIYGALPPETRRQQANLFNDQDNEFDVLVASDAVGMGLNLNIRRVVFNSLSKYNGDKIVPVPASQVKQIAGRAGRRGSRYPDGLTSTLHLDDLDVTFPQLLEKFGENCRLDGSYFLCRHDNIKKVAYMLEKVQGLSLEDRFNFCFAPVNIRDPKAMYHLLKFASSYSQKVPVGIAMGMPKGSAQNDSELLDLETKHQVLSTYLWLSHQFKEETFPYVKKAETMATEIADLLGQSLIQARWKPESRKAGKPRPQQQKDGFERPKSLIKQYIEGIWAIYESVGCDESVG
ncbi:hypothetical protein GH714_030954 [Hevea brasiliensis]|uniref:RNA helicase n=1 Tax=Hevea brasiliensis TaxID=3981 RepID=A0A6A6LGJ1_HEVBR|nr:hypothetical protein GH714_030954 [Hevea brasiliensis]